MLQSVSLSLPVPEQALTAVMVILSERRSITALELSGKWWPLPGREAKNCCSDVPHFFECQYLLTPAELLQAHLTSSLEKESGLWHITFGRLLTVCATVV